VRTTAAASFASDNYAGIHPAALEAIARANAGHATAYGNDPWSAELEERFRELAGDVAVFPVFNGTGANVTSLAALLQPHEAVICSEIAHINVDECGAPERFTGAKLIDLPAPGGKLTPELIEPRLTGVGDEHRVQPRVVSVTQSTEVGTVYTLDELAALSAFCRRHRLLLHVDGARIANAAATLECGLRELVGGVGVDVMSFGGTKNGLLGGEAVLFADPSLARNFLFIRKQAMQLNSKMRFASAQLLALLEGDLWLRNASHANAMARRLRDRVAGAAGVEVIHPVEANAVFARLPAAAIEPLQERHPFYVWDAVESVVRWMCAWDTAEADVDEFAASVREVVER